MKEEEEREDFVHPVQSEDIGIWNIKNRHVKIHSENPLSSSRIAIDKETEIALTRLRAKLFIHASANNICAKKG